MLDDDEDESDLGVLMVSTSHRMAEGIRGPLRNSLDAERVELGMCQDASMILVLA